MDKKIVDKKLWIKIKLWIDFFHKGSLYESEYQITENEIKTAIKKQTMKQKMTEAQASIT